MFRQAKPVEADAGLAPANENEADAALKEASRAFERKARATLKDLSGRFAWPTVALFLSVIAGASAMAGLAIEGYVSWWVAIPVNAVIIYFIFTPLHEAVHGNIAGRHTEWKWLEEVIGHASGLILLAPYPGFRRLHLHHHQHTNDPVEDPDYWVKTNSIPSLILRCLAIQPVYIWHLWRLAKTPVVKREFFFEMVYVGVAVAIVAAAYAVGWGNEVMLGWIVPAYFGVCLCPLMFDWPVHHPHSERGRYTDSAILLFPKPVRFLVDLAFCGHSYHLMHHLYPRIPFYDYGTAYYAMEGDLPGVSAKIRNFAA
ncbi:MAG: fatty acid desaturase [Alphaproteobacteria bacterium]|nr:fatty acid desaturase [Alphaproteobacteria bacterium]